MANESRRVKLAHCEGCESKTLFSHTDAGEWRCICGWEMDDGE